MPRYFELDERERRDAIARGMQRGDLFSFMVAGLEAAGDYLSAPPVPRVPWWRRYRFRLLIFAALAGMILSGSSLH